MTADDEGRTMSRDPGTTTVRLAYGSTGLPVALPASRTTVITPRQQPAAPDPMAELARAIAEPVAGSPLRELVRPGQRVAISICDPTRAQPRDLMVAAVLAELDGVVDPADVVVLVATGTHRVSTGAEKVAMLGQDLLDRVRVLDHDARDERSLTWVGTFGDGVPVWLNRHWVEADVRITTGFVEPHFFAGFSGGPKMVAPGLAGLRTVLTLHDARRIAHPAATWGVCEGNPVHDDVRAVAAATGVTFALDVALNQDQRIVRAFGGELAAMHQQAREHVRAAAMAPVAGRFDVVVTSNSGYPLDQNLYQAVKGISAAATIVRPGGVIVCAAECRDGFPDHGPFREMLTSAADPASLLKEILEREQTVPDQWQAQILARIQADARVVLHTSFLSAADLAGVHLDSTDDVAATVAQELAARGPQARVAVLPEGPQTIPYLVGPEPVPAP